MMLALIGMLVAALYPLQTAGDGYAAQCLFNMSKEQLADIGVDNSPYFGSMIISQMMLVIMFLSRVIKLHQRSTCFTRKWLKNTPSRYWGSFVTFLGRVSQESSGWKLRICLLLHALSLVFGVTAMILVNLMSSLLWDVRTPSCPIAQMILMHCQLLWLFISLVWGTRRLCSTRFKADNRLQENYWTFGQLVPVLLLLTPLLNIVDTWLSMDSFTSVAFRPSI
jgi:hypothetical protein